MGLDWMKLQLSIYESYSNGDITKDACDNLVNSIYNKIGDNIVEEAENAENEFINSSLSVLTENTHDSNLLMEAANTFSDKVKALWEKFKAWLKALINRLFGRKENFKHIENFDEPVSPENKIRIVNAWQRKGNVVAMTGDGVNDAPALKKADIGVAMGITGTEVSKDASAMILMDDNFATIMKAVLNGRNIYRNIMNAIQFLLSGNMAAILVVLFCSAMALDRPFEPVHLLFINLLTDSLPALAIGMEPTDQQLLKNKPRDPGQGILTGRFLCKLFGYGGLIAISTLIAYAQGLMISPVTASTMAFATLTLARLFHGFTCRSDYSVCRIGIRSNKWSVAAFAVGILLLALVFLVPLMRSLFMVEALTGIQIVRIAVLAFAPTFLIQTVRSVKERILQK